MRKRACGCPNCRSAEQAAEIQAQEALNHEFFAIVGNPANGQAPQAPQETLQEMLTAWQQEQWDKSTAYINELRKTP